MPVLNPDAAGVDVGATKVYVAVAEDRDTEPVRSFLTFTRDLEALADWLERCHVRTVAMESTGVYWIPLFQILDARGFEVCLVNARHVKNAPGRKSDVSDCQWLQYLHAVGLLRGSFRPAQAVCAVRSIVRHREAIVRYAGSQVQHMQKALNQMNLHLHHVISDITGQTGLAILDAIVAGERDPRTLAELKSGRIKADLETVEKSLEGDWREEHLFALGQALSTWRHYQKQIAECDAEIARILASFDPPPPGDIEGPAVPRREPEALPAPADTASELARVFGVDLTEIPGVDIGVARTVFTEIGPDLDAFRSAKAFGSWLGLCPDNRVSGDKVLSVQTRKVKSRAATALRMAANSLHRSKTALGEFFRRTKARLGAPKAITATAHKLARIIYHLLTTRQPYSDSVFAVNERRYTERRIFRLKKEAAALGFAVIEGVVS
jgi:transposase